LRLQDYTPARVGLGRAGASLPTNDMLELQLAHARARDSVHAPLDVLDLEQQLAFAPNPCIRVNTQADTREVFLKRPDLGRRLDERSRETLADSKGEFDAVIIVADGLSALACQRHAAPLLKEIVPALISDNWALAPLVIVEQGRVAISDEIGSTVGATLSVILIGERPGLSSPDSLGVYLTYRPSPGLTDAARNCLSNIRPSGLSYGEAAHKLLFLMRESRHRRLSGVHLKEDAGPFYPQLPGAHE
jgi:ethanolamine ammonia-lyase small subunit